MLLRLQMTKGNVGSLLVFDPSKITIDQPVKEASGEAVVGIVTERGLPSRLGLSQLHVGTYISRICEECPHEVKPAGRAVFTLDQPFMVSCLRALCSFLRRDNTQ